MKKLLVFVVTMVLTASSCASGDGAGGSTDVTVTSTSTSTAPPPDRAVSVDELIANPEARNETVAGAVLWDQEGTRLCDALMESYPPQCGDPSVVIANPEALDLEFQQAGGIWWNDEWIEIDGHFDGEIFTVESAMNLAQPTDEELGKAAALVASAQVMDPAAVAEVGFAEQVALGLGDRVTFTVASDTLESSKGWTLDVEEYEGYAGPFSALDLLRDPYEVTVGTHPRCVADPSAAPEGMETFRQLSIQPTDATSCLEWWAVDLYLNPNGEVAAVVLDLYGP